jgi:hypothetical protein
MGTALIRTVLTFVAGAALVVGVPAVAAAAPAGDTPAAVNTEPWD